MLSFIPCERCPPLARLSDRNVSPGFIIAMKAARFAFAPLCGCTLANRQPKSCLARSIARVLDLVVVLASAVVAAPGYPSAYLLVSTVPAASITAAETWFSLAISSSVLACRCCSLAISSAICGSTSFKLIYDLRVEVRQDCSGGTSGNK